MVLLLLFFWFCFVCVGVGLFVFGLLLLDIFFLFFVLSPLFLEDEKARGFAKLLTLT